MVGLILPFSMEPNEFREMVDSIRNVERALGNVKYDITDYQRGKRRSLYARTVFTVGDVFNCQNVGSYRPGVGLSPQYWDQIMGKTCKREIVKGDVLRQEDLK